MAWTTPVDQATGFLVTAAIYNAHVIDNLAYLHGDAGAAIDLTAGGQFLRASGLQVGAADTSIGRTAPGQLSLGGTAGKGNTIGGYATLAPGGPATLTPDAACLFNRYAPINAGGTYTIAAPSNPPGAGQSGFFFLCIQNNAGGVITLAYNAIYVLPTATPTAGLGSLQMFVWDSGTSKWIGTAAVGSVAM
jgi:hypothetical protein